MEIVVFSLFLIFITKWASTAVINMVRHQYFLIRIQKTSEVSAEYFLERMDAIFSFCLVHGLTSQNWCKRGPEVAEVCLTVRTVKCSLKKKGKIHFLLGHRRIWGTCSSDEK